MGHDADDLVSLAPGESCRMFVDFEVAPDKQRLRTLTMTHDGVTRGSVAVPIVVTFERDSTRHRAASVVA